MFGYIRISKGELKVKEYELYRGVYCSLCKVLGKNYGLVSRFTLNYDFTFLCLLNMSLKDGCDKFTKKGCTFNPLKKCQFCDNTEALEMPSAAAMIMSYYKLLDNIEDEKGIKKFGYLILKPFLKSANKKAKKKYPYIEEIVAQYISKQAELEKSDCKEIDRVADPTAIALSKLLMLCSEDSTQKRVLERLGYCLGRYVYILDAFCDLEEDIKKGRYNVLKSKPKTEVCEYIKSQIYFCINESTKAFELLDIKKYKSVLGNIIYLGLEDTAIKELENERSL
ncbi:MAG: hypothetical protein IKT44_05130 [Clostridia bacterium]|nr:hypothetical protein [Clostridia bacterium]